MTFQISDTKKICCIGAGYVGTPTMTMIAHHCPDITVTVVDKSSERISAWNSVNLDDFPIYEPGLDKLVMQCRGTNLFFSTDIEGAISECDIIFVCVNTPTKTCGFGAGRAADLGPWEIAGRTIARAASRNKIIIEKSTVPVRTAEALSCVIQESALNNVEHVILSNPEFLAEGSAIKDLERPDRVLIGGPQTEAGQYAISVVSEIYAIWIPKNKILRTNLWSSELSKLVANAFLAQRVSSINSVSLICEHTGADVEEVSLAVGADSRIGPNFLTASLGFGGSCFQKDILNLVYISEQLGLNQVAAYWNQVICMNELRKSQFAKCIVNSLFNTVSGKRLAVFGFTFKKDTSDTRESPAISVCSQLLCEGAELAIYDPRVRASDVRDELVNIDRVQICKSPTDAATHSHAIIVLTEWEVFKTLDYRSFFDKMQKPAFVFDGRNILHHRQLISIGFKVRAIGKTF